MKTYLVYCYYRSCKTTYNALHVSTLTKDINWFSITETKHKNILVWNNEVNGGEKLCYT